jgi:hypothetical protein
MPPRCSSEALGLGQGFGGTVCRDDEIRLPRRGIGFFKSVEGFKGYRLSRRRDMSPKERC